MRTLINQSRYLIAVFLSISIFVLFYSYSADDMAFCSSGACGSHLIQPATIWSNIRSRLALDHSIESARVQAEIRKLMADKQKLYDILRASAPYIYFINRETQTHRLPAELALIPVIESEFNPRDHSNKGADGLWQLMPQTASELGIRVSERRNVVSSTHAALAYLTDLKNDFRGDWYLAISAYNAGQGTVKHAIRRAGSRNFWNLNRLPIETKLYLPKLLALAAIIKNPEKYGMRLPPIINKPYFITLTMRSPVNLAKIARTTGMDIKTLHALNPDYRHESAQPNKHGAYTLLIPVKAAETLKNTLGNKVISTKV